MVPEGIWKWAQLKGINVMGTGDFTHPQWFKELTKKFEPTGHGLFYLREEYRTQDVFPSCMADVFFILTAEISCIYSKKGRTRKVHCLIFVPDFESAARINIALSRVGNLSSDGRPILGLDAKELLNITLDSGSDNMFIPAHAWTPHFSVFGAGSGFDSLDECFEELTPHIYAIETGLSSDPPMNWRLSALDRITLISNSDAHSALKIGREANIFDITPSYRGFMEAIKTRKGFIGTIEFFPEEGKYHYDGHRSCGVGLSPEETINHHNYICPVCGKRLTVGVMHRVTILADRQDGFKPHGSPEYRNLIPLAEILSEALKTGVGSKAVMEAYMNMLKNLGNEFSILLDTSLDEIERVSSPIVREAIARMREGRIHIAPGYDGEYGKIKIFEEIERREIRGQMRLL